MQVSMTESSDLKLYRRMCEEQKEFKKELLSMPPEEMLQHSYAYNIREDILLIMQEIELTDRQAKALLKSEHPLCDIFERRENHESQYMNELRDNIEAHIDEVIKAERQKENKMQGR